MTKKMSLSCLSLSCIDPKTDSGHEIQEIVKGEHYEDWAKALNETVTHSLSHLDDSSDKDFGGKATPGGNVLALSQNHDESHEENHSPVTKALLQNMAVQAPKQETGLEDLEEGDEIFQGQFKGETHLTKQWHGHGTLKVKKGKSSYVYDGEFEDGAKNGKGVMRWADGRMYRGSFKDDQVHGDGVMSWPDGRKYVGQYVNGLKHGTGIFYFKEDGRQHEGQWRNGKRHGKGVYTNSNDDAICGHWIDDRAVESSLEKVPKLGRSDQGLLLADVSKKK